MGRIGFAREALLLRRYKLSDFDGRDRHELLVDQIGARQAAVERRPAFAEQVFDAEFLAQLAMASGKSSDSPSPAATIAT